MTYPVRVQRTKTPRWSLAPLAHLVRLAVLLFAVHVSGLAHGVIDFVRTCEAVQLHESDDCNGGDDDRCPADCPNCHCAHGAMALPSRPTIYRFVSFDAKVDALRPSVQTTPPQTDLGCVFRPPRSALS
ncbi:hypothetical protein BH09MYX1_BH09MYX1_26600 [soil metagenome]